MDGKKVLLVDDITDTGESMKVALDYIKSLNPSVVKTDKNGGHKGISMVYVPADSPGIEMYKINNIGRP